MKKILAVDLGAKMGWATNKYDNISSGTEDLSPKKGENEGVRYVNMLQFLRQFDDTENLCRHASMREALIVYYESVAAHKGNRAAHLY